MEKSNVDKIKLSVKTCNYLILLARMSDIELQTIFLVVFFSITNFLNQSENSVMFNHPDYIEMFYNSHRRHSYWEYVSPREFENSYFVQNAA